MAKHFFGFAFPAFVLIRGIKNIGFELKEKNA